MRYSTHARVRPANIFVAGFIGGPPMNFLAGAAVAAGALSLDCGGTRGSIGRSPLADGASRDVVLGVRPQDVRVHGSVQDDCIEGVIAMVQLVGSEKLVELAYGRGGEVTAQVKADVQLAVGQRVWIGFDAARLHLFDPASGRNLAPAG